MTNIPEVKLGIIAVSRDCFVISLSEPQEGNCRKRPGKRRLHL